MNEKYLRFSVYLPIIILVPFIIISAFNHPALDDWWYAETYTRFGVAGAQAYWYNHYTARFVSNFLMTIAPLSFRWIEGEKVMPAVFIVSLYATFFYITKTFFQRFTASRLLLALWFTVAYLLIQRDYFECLYWLSSNVVYQFPMLFFMLHLSMLYRIYYEKNRRPHLLILSILLSAAVTGSNEVLGGLLLVECIGLLIWTFYKNTLKQFSMCLLVVQLLCWIVMLLAPGNWSKINDATHDHVYTFFFIKAISYSLLSVGYYSLFLVKQLPVWCLIFLSLPLWKHLLVKKFLIDKANHFLLVAFLSFCCAVAIYFISIYPTGILIPPLRVTNVAIVFLFSGISLFILGVSEKITALQKTAEVAFQKRYLLMIVCVASAFITPTRYQLLVADIISGRAKNYNKTMYDRYAVIRRSNTDTLFIEKLKDVPQTIVPSDVTGKVSEDIGLIFDKKNTIIIR